MSRKQMYCLALCAMLLACCRNEPVATTDTADTRPAVFVEYVASPELKVYAQPDAASALLTSYQNGESVSVLSTRGPWVEVRTAGGSGWAQKSDLQGAAASRRVEADNITPRFRKIPAPITQTTAHGEIVLEADVNSQGAVLSVRTLRNTTGSMALEVQNTQELQRAQFYPMVQHGNHVPFVYEYRVHY